jgi:hypothetical protein
LTDASLVNTISPAVGRSSRATSERTIRKETPVSARRVSVRSFVAAWILGLLITLIPMATALADGTGTWFPR